MLARTGIPAQQDLEKVLPGKERLSKGPVAIFECFQEIPCNPCADACPRKAVTVRDINDRPVVDESLCNGCGVCMAHCPGLAIFVVDLNYSGDQALIKLPYEFWPLPQIGQTVAAIDRTGWTVGQAKVVKVQKMTNKTNIVWLEVPKDLAMEVRHIKP